MARTNLKTAALFAVLSGVSLSANAAPVLFNGHYYDVIISPSISWASADLAAQASSYLGVQGHLATLTSGAEDAFVDSQRNAAGGGEFYVGGFQLPTELSLTGGWTWVNGEGTFAGTNAGPGYANWLPGEPNDFYGAGSEQFLAIGHGGFGWNDEGAVGNVSGYVVEYNVPEPGTLGLLGLGLVALRKRARKQA